MSVLGSLSWVNNPAFQFAGAIANPLLTFLMKYIAESFVVVLALIIIYLYLKKDKNVFSFIVAFVLLFIIGEVIKFAVREPRPCQIEDFQWASGLCETGFSFPSNHAITLSGLIFFIKGYKYLRILYLIWLLLVLFGRVYLGEHYLSDVLAGAALSLVIAFAIYAYREKINLICAMIANRLLKPIFNDKWVR